MHVKPTNSTMKFYPQTRRKFDREVVSSSVGLDSSSIGLERVLWAQAAGWARARPGKARQGQARPGKARQGRARPGKAGQGWARRQARPGKAAGKAGQGA